MALEPASQLGDICLNTSFPSLSSYLNFKLSMETLLKPKRKPVRIRFKAREQRRGSPHDVFLGVFDAAYAVYVKNRTAAKFDRNDSFIASQGFTDTTDEKMS